MSGNFFTQLLTGILIFLVVISQPLYAQHFNFSQYNYTPLRINPGIVASDNDAKAILNFRNQQTSTDLAFKSNLLTLSYPLLSKKTKQRWGGIGLSAFDDRAIGAGEFVNQTIALNLAYNFKVKSNLQLSVGLQTNYNNQRFSANGISTGAQYRGGQYDPNVQPGENFNETGAHNFSFSSGFYLYNPDDQERNKYYAGLSLYDFNRPNSSVVGRKESIPSILILTAGYRIYETSNFDVTPELLYTSVSGTVLINVGGVVSFDLKNAVGMKSGRLDASARYVIGRTAIVALQFNKPKYFIGFSYDTSAGINNNAARQNAIELSFGLKKTIKAGVKKKKKKKKKAKKKSRKKKKKAKKKSQESPAVARKVVTKKSPAVPAPASTDTLALNDKQENGAFEMEDQIKQDSIKRVKGILKVLSTLKNFEFDFNSTIINEKSKVYLDDLVLLLKTTPDLNVAIIGHTDNVGDPKINIEISKRRALMVKKYLEQKGIESIRIIADGKGEAEPLFSNKTDLERAKNRRVEFNFTQK